MTWEIASHGLEFAATLDAAVALVEKVLPEPAPFFLTIACANKYACSYGAGNFYEGPTPAIALLRCLISVLAEERNAE